MRRLRLLVPLAPLALAVGCGGAGNQLVISPSVNVPPTPEPPVEAHPENADGMLPTTTAAGPVELTWPERAPLTAPTTPVVTDATGSTVPTATPETSDDVERLAIVQPIDPPEDSGPVATDPIRVEGAPNRPVGVPLLPGEAGYVACQVSIIGDSLTVAGGNDIAQALRGEGCAAVSIAAKGGANTRYGARLAKDLLDAGFLTDVVLVNMGTNDCATSAREMDSEIEQMFDVLGDDRLVVWPTSNISKTTPYCEPSGDDLANERIFAAAARHSNMVVVDWWSLADQHPEWHYDGVHHTGEGRRAWSYILAQGVADAVSKRIAG